jgi:hypothetical protein
VYVSFSQQVEQRLATESASLESLRASASVAVAEARESAAAAATERQVAEEAVGRFKGRLSRGFGHACSFF